MALLKRAWIWLLMPTLVACSSLSQGVSDVGVAVRNSVGLAVSEKIGVFGSFDLERIKLKEASSAPLKSVAVIPASSGIALMAVDGTDLKKIIPGSGSVDNVAAASSAQIQAPSAVVVSVRHWLVLSATNGTAFKIDRDSGEVVMAVSHLNLPRGIVEMADGSILIAESGSGVLSRHVQNKPNDKTNLISGLNQPGAMTQSSGGVFVSETGAGRVLRVDPVMGRYTVLTKDIQAPQGIAVTSSGRIAVFEAGTKNMLSIDQITGASAVRASNLPISGSADSPVYISAARDEVLYFSSSNQSDLYRLVRRN